MNRHTSVGGSGNGLAHRPLADVLEVRSDKAPIQSTVTDTTVNHPRNRVQIVTCLVLPDCCKSYYQNRRLDARPFSPCSLIGPDALHLQTGTNALGGSFLISLKLPAEWRSGRTAALPYSI